MITNNTPNRKGSLPGLIQTRLSTSSLFYSPPNSPLLMTPAVVPAVLQSNKQIPFSFASTILEETDSHKEGTELRARSYIRQSIANNRYLSSNYHLLSLEGWGSNGAVLGATCLLSQKQVAVKFIYKSDKYKKIKLPTPQSELPNELRISCLMNHTNILTFLDWFEDKSCFYIVTELVEVNPDILNALTLTSLSTAPEFMTVRLPFAPFVVRLKVQTGTSDLFTYVDLHSTVPHENIKDMFSRICHGVRYMHSNGLVHRDLKEENILITSDLVPKLCDFGHTVQGDKFDVVHYGSNHMAAPELIRNVVNLRKKRTKDVLRYSGYEADIWALGLLLYAMNVGILQGELDRFVAKVEKGKVAFDTFPGTWEKIDDVICVDLIKRMLAFDVNKRLTIDEVFAHPFMS